MKTRGLFLSALFMSAVFAGCSNDEINDIPVENKNVKHESYMSINIVSASETGSRAATDGGFKVGTAAENEVNDLILVFFDANGNFYNAQSPKFTWETVDGTNPAVEKKSNVVVVFNNPEVKPASFVALLNTGLSATTFEGKSLADVKGMVSNYASIVEKEGNETNYFVMSNSVYVDGGIQVAAPITDEMICSKEEDAIKNPAIAYVERIATKLEAVADASVTVTGKEVTLNGKKVTLTPTITGLNFVHTASTSNLLKNINGFEITAPFNGWNDANNFRSYWANSYAEATYGTESYDETAINGATSWSEYANENTSTTTTKLLVTATISGATEDGTLVDIYKYKGYYYTKDGLTAEIASILKGKGLKYTKEETESDNWASVLTVTHPEGVEQWEGVIGVAEDVTVDEATAAEIAKLEKVLWWNEGKCYFFVPVEHLGGKTGVVRNHWYQLAVNSVSGLGTPVADPTEPIDPNVIEDETYYVAAQVQILKWKMVSQDVSLK